MGRTLTDILRGDADVWASVVEVVLLALVLIPGSGPWSGPVLLSLTETHGVHLFDLVIVGMWLLVFAAAVRRGLVRELTGQLLRSLRHAAPLVLRRPAQRAFGDPAVTLA